MSFQSIDGDSNVIIQYKQFTPKYARVLPVWEGWPAAQSQLEVTVQGQSALQASPATFLR